MDSAKITICIPAYNQPEFLRQALSSLCDQGLSRKEYVVAISDDASPTPLGEVIARFENTLQIDYHRHEANVGHIANFMHSFAMAKTPYVSFLPHDDLIAPGQLGRALKVLEVNPAAVLAASLVLCQSCPGALDTRLHGTFLQGSSRANYAEPYLWDRTEWMALALTTTPLSIVGSVFHAETFATCRQWTSFLLWHDRLMMAEMGLHGAVVSLPWIGGYYRTGSWQLSSKIWDNNRTEFLAVSKLILDMCGARGIPVIAFWVDHICQAAPDDRVRYLQMLNLALTRETFTGIKRAAEARLQTRLHLGGRLDRLGIPRPLVDVLRRVERGLSGTRQL